MKQERDILETVSYIYKFSVISVNFPTNSKWISWRDFFVPWTYKLTVTVECFDAGRNIEKH